jgi:lactoylglutathione lyase
MRVSHVALWTRDIAAAAHFWKHYFDAEIGSLYQSARRPGFASLFVRLPSDSVRIELMTAPWVAGKETDECIGWDHIAISLGSHEAVATLAARCDFDGLLLSKPRTTGDGFYEAVIGAPDGTRVEITT